RRVLFRSPALGAFARFEHQPARLDPGRGERGIDRPAPVRGDVDVGDDRHARLAQQPAALSRDIGQQAATDAYLVGPAGELDGNHSHSSSAWRMRLTASPWGPASLMTLIGASA